MTAIPEIYAVYVAHSILAIPLFDEVYAVTAVCSTYSSALHSVHVVYWVHVVHSVSHVHTEIGVYAVPPVSSVYGMPINCI